MAKICFVSYEIHPAVSGGCGVLLYNAARLLLSQGHEVIFLLDLHETYFRQFNEVDRLQLPNPEHCRAYHVQQLTEDEVYPADVFDSVYHYYSHRFHRAASQVYQIEKPDVIEFFEYLGVAYYALTAKAAGLDYQNTHLAVRLHGSMELIDRQQLGDIHTVDRYFMYNLERQALKLAETVLYPSESFLEKAYRPAYERWFGETVQSPPPMIEKPSPVGKTDQANIILFYGRLVGMKGVDLFVDAAVLYLSDSQNPRRDFYLVGYDSNLPPNGRGTYQSYLRKKIPAQYLPFFHFTGKLSWQELGELLPRVLFAAIPSHFESFCYAAHELYEAGVPLIVSNIPAFEDSFVHGKNALVFDGSAGDLAKQMTRLSLESALRQQIKFPYPVLRNPLGDFYNLTLRPSWMESRPSVGMLSLLVCILCDTPEQLDSTLDSIRAAPIPGIRVIFAYPAKLENADLVRAWFLGKITTFQDEQGVPLLPTQVKTSEALMILRAGDILDPGYLPTALAAMRCQPAISFVGGWKSTPQGRGTTVDTTAYDVSLELLPIKGRSAFSRSIIRTIPGNLLIDLFDPRAGELGEIAYLWQLDDNNHCGIVLPKPMLSTVREVGDILSTSAVDFLMLSDQAHWRKSRLARYLLSLDERANVLRKNKRVEGLLPVQNMASWIRNGIYWLGDTRINRWMNQNLPWAKAAVRKIGKTLHLYQPKES